MWAGSAARSILASARVHVSLTVVDNVSKRSGELGGYLPAGTEIIRSPRNGGYTGGANLALKDWLSRPETEFCILCSHDLHVTPDAIHEMLAQMQFNPEYAVIEPTIWQQEPKGHMPDAPALREVKWATGACLMLRRSSVQGIYFDERFGSYVEDVDFCLRVSDAGHKIGWATRAVAWELGSTSTTAGVRVKANTIRLEAKRNGLKGFVCATSSLALWGLRFGIATCMLWRPRDRRVASRRECVECFRALAAVVQPGLWKCLSQCN